jgi:hypothetical protein
MSRKEPYRNLGGMKTQQILTAMAALALVAGCSGGKQAAKATPTPSADLHRMMLDIAQRPGAWRAQLPGPRRERQGDWDFPPAQLDRQPKVTACDSLIIRMKRAHPQKVRPTISPQDLVKLREYAVCMRQQGVSDWPDPGPDRVFKMPANSAARNPGRAPA